MLVTNGGEHIHDFDVHRDAAFVLCDEMGFHRHQQRQNPKAVNRAEVPGRCGSLPQWSRRNSRPRNRRPPVIRIQAAKIAHAYASRGPNRSKPEFPTTWKNSLSRLMVAHSATPRSVETSYELRKRYAGLGSNTGW